MAGTIGSGFSNRIYIPGEKPPQGVRQGDTYKQYYYLRIGLIQEVDLDKYELTVQWMNKKEGVRDRVPISFPYWGPSGCIGSLPSKGSLGVFGFYDEGDGKGAPLLLSCLPTGLDAGLNYNKIKILPDAMSTSDINEIQYKFRKMTVGDMAVTASGGASLFLNKSVELKDDALDSIFIREDDQAIIATSLNNFIFADGISVNMGPALRNKLKIYDSNGNKLDNNGSLVTHNSGKDNIYIVPHGEPITGDTLFYSEYRIDVDEYGNGKLDLNDINSSSPISDKDPIVTMTLGNYIGADFKDPQKYGSLLKARLFASANDNKGAFALEKAVQNNGLDEPEALGLAYAMHFLKAQAFIGMDKEGHYYMNLPASTRNPLGAGRSMSILAQGNLKEIWGVSTDINNSWDLTAKGGLRWNIGAHNQDFKGRSIDIRTSKSIYINVAGKDDDGFAKQENLKGNVSEIIMGDKTETVSNITYKINGLKTENIGGSYSESVQSDKSINVLGVFSETVVKEKQSKIGTRKTTITTGNDELTVLRGNITETITTFGKRSTTITAGSIENSLIAGNFKNSVKAGNYEVSVTAGAIKVKSSAGAVSISGSAVNIEGQLLVNVSAPIVKIGTGATPGGALVGLPGVPSAYDPVVGTPFSGSMKVGIAI